MSVALFLHFVKLRMRERMEYRGAYLLGIVAQVLGWGAEYAVIYLLLHRFESIGGWTWPEVAFLFSLDLFSYALGASFAFSPMIELERMVVRGDFDTILARPLNPLLHLSARKYNVGYLAHVIISGSFLAWSVGQLGGAWGPAGFAYLVVAILAAACLQAAALIAIGSITFVVIQSHFAFSLYYSLKSFLSFPLTVYGIGVQWLLTFAIPLAFINFYPASLLLSKDGGILSPAVGLIAPVVGPATLYAAYRLFGAAVSRYQGAGG